MFVDCVLLSGHLFSSAAIDSKKQIVCFSFQAGFFVCAILVFLFVKRIRYFCSFRVLVGLSII